MANWRSDIKTFFENMIGSVTQVQKFGEWNNKVRNVSDEETYSGDLAVFFQYTSIGSMIEYTNTERVKQAGRTPVVVTLYLVFNSFNEDAQDLAYSYAHLINCEVLGSKHNLIHGRILKESELEDANHKAQYVYELSYRFEVIEKVDLTLTDANPETQVNPDPNTGRRLRRQVTVTFPD